MKKLKICFVLFWALLFSSPLGAQVRPKAGDRPAAQTSPEKWLAEKGRDFLDALSEQSVKTRYVKLRRICSEIFNHEEMTRLSMNKRWNEMTKKQQEELKFLFIDYFVVTYGSFGADFSKSTFRVTETVPVKKDFLLRTQVKLSAGIAKAAAASQKDAIPLKDKEDGSDFESLFSLRPRAGGYYIRDAKFEGQSVLLFLRSFMEEEYREAGFDTEKLLEKIRKTINDRYRAAEDLAKAEQAK